METIKQHPNDLNNIENEDTQEIKRMNKKKAYYKNRTTVLKIFPDCDMWTATVLYNSETKKYELELSADLDDVWECPDNTYNSACLEDVICNIYNRMKKSDGGMYSAHCFGEEAYNLMKKKFIIGKEINKIDRSNDYPHYKPGRDFEFKHKLFKSACDSDSDF
jgi:hypothetical protein